MKLLLTIILGLLALPGSSQEVATVQLLYDLTKRTIEDFGKGKVKVVKSPIMPFEFWDTKNRRPMTSKYFSTEDLDAISTQVTDPIVKTWDVGTIKEISNVRLVNKPRGNNCLLISLPILSADSTTIVICYRSWDRHSVADFVTVWKKEKDKWTKEKEEMILISKKKAPAHNTSYGPLWGDSEFRSLRLLI